MLNFNVFNLKIVILSEIVASLLVVGTSLEVHAFSQLPATRQSPVFNKADAE